MVKRSLAFVLILASMALATDYYLIMPSAAIALGYLGDLNPYYQAPLGSLGNIAADLQGIFGTGAIITQYYSWSSNEALPLSGTSDANIWRASYVPGDVGIVLLDTGVMYDPQYFACLMDGIAPAALVEALNTLGACGDYGTITWKDIYGVISSINGYGGEETFNVPNTDDQLKYCVTNSEALNAIGFQVAEEGDTVIILQPTDWKGDFVGHGTAVAGALCGQVPGLSANGDTVNLIFGPARGAKVFVVNTAAYVIVLKNFEPELTNEVSKPTILLKKAQDEGVTIEMDWEFKFLGYKAAIADYLLSLQAAQDALNAWASNNGINRKILLPELAVEVDENTLNSVCKSSNGVAFNLTALTDPNSYNIQSPSNPNPQDVNVNDLATLANGYIAIVAPAGNEGFDVGSLNSNNGLYVAPAQCYKYFDPNVDPLIVVVNGLKLNMGQQEDDNGNPIDGTEYLYVDDKYGNYDFKDGDNLYTYWLSMPASANSYKFSFVIQGSAGTNQPPQSYILFSTSSGLPAFGVSINSGNPQLAVPYASSLSVSTSTESPNNAYSTFEGTSLASAYATAVIAIALNYQELNSPLRLKGLFDTLFHDGNDLKPESSNIGYGPIPVEWLKEYVFDTTGTSWYNLIMPLPTSTTTNYNSALPGESQLSSSQSSSTEQTSTSASTSASTSTEGVLTVKNVELASGVPVVFLPLNVLVRKLSKKFRRRKG